MCSEMCADMRLDMCSDVCLDMRVGVLDRLWHALAIHASTHVCVQVCTTCLYTRLRAGLHTPSAARTGTRLPPHSRSTAWHVWRTTVARRGSISASPTGMSGAQLRACRLSLRPPRRELSNCARPAAAACLYTRLHTCRHTRPHVCPHEPSGAHPKYSLNIA